MEDVTYERVLPRLDCVALVPAGNGAAVQRKNCFCQKLRKVEREAHSRCVDRRDEEHVRISLRCRRSSKLSLRWTLLLLPAESRLCLFPRTTSYASAVGKGFCSLPPS